MTDSLLKLYIEIFLSESSIILRSLYKPVSSITRFAMINAWCPIAVQSIIIFQISHLEMGILGHQVAWVLCS